MKKSKVMTQAQIIEKMTRFSGFTTKQAKLFYSTQAKICVSELRDSGAVTIPELGVKLVVVDKPATEPRKGRNPFTGEEIMIKAKPARKDIKARIMRKLKEAMEAD